MKVVVQDEFSHDVVMAGPDGVYLCFDTTGLGGVNDVSVWDGMPTADELLDAGLATGWKTTPTGTVGGDKIFGRVTNLR